MKKIYLALAFATVLISCGNTKNEAELQAKQFTIDSLKQVSADKETQRISTERNLVTEKQVTVVQPVTTTTQAAPKKKGMSNVAKGAIIGGVIGAGTGVAVSKDKVKGGVIGAVVGAGAGAGVGALIKKKQ